MDSKRLVLEHRAMMERWSALRPRLRADRDGTNLRWELELRAENGNRLPITIEYPENYPSSPPVIRIRCDMPPGTPHLLGGSQMCWHYPGESSRNRNIWDPGRDTAAMCVGVAMRWFYAFLVWLTTGTWPVRDAI